LYQQYNGTVDEWTLSVAMASDTANGGLSQLEQHYNTFIVSLSLIPIMPMLTEKTQTEQDFAEIAGAGLNWVRIPLPYWAIEVRDGEPFLKQTAWKCVHSCPKSFSVLNIPQLFSQGYSMGA
jgi:glucan 1,3-beta-glucosidase